MSTTPLPPDPPLGGPGASSALGPDGGAPPAGGTPPPGGRPSPGAPSPDGPRPDGASAPPGTPGPRRAGADGFFDGVRRVGIARSDDRWIGGVAAGVADRFGIDPLLVRGILFVTFFLSGAGLVLYGAAWALLPERRDGRIHLQEALRGSFDVAMLGAIAMVVVGLSWGGGWWSWWDYLDLGWLTGLFWVAAIVVVAVVAVSVLRRDGDQGPRPGSPGFGPGTGAAPGTAPHGEPGTTSVPGATAPVPGPAPTVAAVDAPWGTPGPASTVAAGGRSDAAPAGTTWAAPGGPYGATAAAPGATAGARFQAPPPAAPVPPPAPMPPRPPRPPRPHGPGSATVGVVVGLSLLLGALLLVVDRAGDLPWPVFLTWLGASVVLAGLAVVVSGLRGRTSGALGWLAVLGLVVGVPTALWQDERAPFVLDGDARQVTQGVHTVVLPDVAEEGFAVRWGSSTIDLSQLDLSDASASSPVEVPIELGAGDVTIVVPDGVPVRADVQVLAGSAYWNVDGQRREVGGVSTRPVTFENAEVDEGEEPLLVLDVVVGAGQATIEED